MLKLVFSKRVLKPKWDYQFETGRVLFRIWNCSIRHCIQVSKITILFASFAVCWRTRTFMATIIRHPRPSLFLFPLLLCEWSGSHRCHVHGILISCKCSRYPTLFCSHGPSLPLEHHGWSHPLRDRFSPSFLRCWLRSTFQVVGLRVPHLHRQYHYLARSWWDLVEVHWLVVDIEIFVEF